MVRAPVGFEYKFRPVNLLDSLRASPVLPQGRVGIPIPIERIDLRTAAALHLWDRGYSKEPLPFETVHERLAPELDASGPGLAATLSTRLHGAPAEARAAYHELIGFLAHEVFGFDVVFEADPALRFHVPGPMPQRYRSRADGRLLAYHSDLLLGDYFEQFNCWLPLCEVVGTSALHAAPLTESIEILERFIELEGLDADSFATSRERFFEVLDTDEELCARVCASVAPLETHYGELIVFDPRLVHGTTENHEATTRVSIDFRVLPKAAYEAHQAAVAAGRETARAFDGQPLVRGGYYDLRTAFEL